MKKIATLSEWGGEVFPLMSWFDSDKVKNAKVMVVGAGALGNEVLKNLALFGIGNIIIIDFDHIEKSNLCRSVLFRMDDAELNRSKAEVAADSIREINPTINVKHICGDIGTDVGLGLFREMDVVIGCLDNRLARYLINRNCFRADKPWIDGGIENLEGNVRIYKPGVNCYECGLSEIELDQLYYRTGCPDIAKFNVTQGRVATTPISASIIGAIQVQEALKIIHGYDDKTEEFACKTLEGRMLKYDGMVLGFNKFKSLNYEPDCLSHDLWTPVKSLPGLSAKLKISEALNIIGKELKTEDFSINLVNNKFVHQLIPESTEEEIEVQLPESKVAAYIEDNAIKKTALERVFQSFYEEITHKFPYQELTFEEAGIPSYDIIRVTTEDAVHYLELSADKKEWL